MTNRRRRATFATTMLVAAAAWFPATTAQAAAATTDDAGRERTAAERVIEAMTGNAGATGATEVTGALPADFETVMGYAPVLEDGHLAAPEGVCSSPIPLPTEFEPACRRHDLGYDLLRYSAAAGSELGPWARKALDADLDRNMHAACESRPEGAPRTTCTAFADIAATAVRVNSLRQHDGVPADERMLLGVGGGAALAVGVALVAAHRHRRVRAPRAATTDAVIV
ncbi:hypothetical protein [Rhodococcus sp. HNM0569]|uniref:hypothetical protein n=1 Tax=Rhodococcus sp. HNM0569 TaxID=2716340 RepID=UPI00146DE526|nr:hypothetical protein [Rhodococcus sp. HNM0569]NLU81600.1 hypothetical protein [Rhodococcus sp. HNM0569]